MKTNMTFDELKCVGKMITCYFVVADDESELYRVLNTYFGDHDKFTTLRGPVCINDKLVITVVKLRDDEEDMKLDEVFDSVVNIV